MIKRLAALVVRFKRADFIKAVKLNQHVVGRELSPPREDVERRTQAVMVNALSCYYDFFHNLDNDSALSGLFPRADHLLSKLRKMTAQNGALIVTPHLSNFNLLFQVITTKGFQSKLLTLTSLYSGYDLINTIRSRAGADIVAVNQGDYFMELVNYLQSGGIVVTAVDRPIQERNQRHRMEFFNQPSALPAGYINLAITAEVPVIILSAFMKRDGTYDYHLLGPIPIIQYQTKLETIKRNVEGILGRLEVLIKETPDQWLMYYPVWPHLMK